MSAVQTWAPRVLAGFLVLLGALLAFGHVRAVHFGRAAAQWPTVTGELSVQHGVNRRTRHFRYDYEVAGERYRGHDASFMPGPMYRPGRHYETGPVAVRYDPQRPSRAVLEPGVSWLGFAWSLLAPLALVAAGVWILVASERAGRDFG